MAVQCSVADRHLYSVSTDFLRSTVPFSITVWIKALWSNGSIYSLVGMYDGGLTGSPATTTGVQLGSRGTGRATAWTYGGTILVQSDIGDMSSYDDVWVLVTYTFDGTTHRLYRNETLIGTGTTTPVDGKFTQVYINGYPPTGNAAETASYQVDSYAYYGRTLAAEEITTIYNCFGTRHGISNGLIARYDFDESAAGQTVTSVADVSGNNNSLQSAGSGTAITYVYEGCVANSNLRPVQ